MESDKEGVMGPAVRRSGRLLLLTGCLILAGLGLGTVAAHAAAPTSLAGETFTSQTARGSTLTGTCTGNDNEGSFTFSVSGTAAGPFPGTFTETGSFTVRPSGFLNDFSSTFIITSTAGTVTGSKLLAGDTSTATCSNFGGGSFVSAPKIDATYTATINGVQGATGPAMVSLDGVLDLGPPGFSESFGSIGLDQLTSKEQCKKGGWQSFGFRNQGDCISFVATGGKNAPSGS